MSETLHTVVGSSGAVGRALLRQLSAREPAVTIRTVSRTASASPNHVAASCLDRQAIIDACRGSTVVYLVIGLKYDKKVWKRDWPAVISNVLEACKQSNATLVFADNLYCYGDVGDAQLAPSLPYATGGHSVKSLVRAQVAHTIESSGVPYVIVRASDFYGADCTDVSHFGDYVVPPLLKDGTAKFVVEPNRWRHSLTHTDDFARALVIAGSDPRALNRAWHVPCAPAKTFAEYAQMIALAVHESGGPPPAKRTSSLLMPAFGITLMSHFVGFLGELRDMRHVWDRDYVVDDSAFRETFGSEFGAPTDLSVGFRALVDAYRAKAST